MIDKELQDLYSNLGPLFIQLRELQNKYRIQYEGELSNGDRSAFWQNLVEEFYFKTNCDIDTLQNGWEPFINDFAVSPLI